MRIDVTIHRVLRKFLDSPVSEETHTRELPEGATPQSVLDELRLRKQNMCIFFFVNRRKVGSDHTLEEGDHLMIYPPQKFNVLVGQITSQVARAVQTNGQFPGK